MKTSILLIILATLNTKVIIDPQSDPVEPARVQELSEKCVELECSGNKLESIWIFYNKAESFTQVVCGCSKVKPLGRLTQKRLNTLRKLVTINE